MRISLACSVLLLGVVACVSDPELDSVQDSSRPSSEARVASAADSVAADIAPALACKKPDHVCKRGGVTACCLPSMNCQTCLGVAAVDAAHPDTESQTGDGSMVAAVPEDLQLITPRVTCGKGGVCTSLRLCEGSGQHTIAGKCPAGDVCCS